MELRELGILNFIYTRVPALPRMSGAVGEQSTQFEIGLAQSA